MAALLAGCGAGADGDPCGASGAALEIVDPREGQTVTSADDVEPGGGIEYDVRVATCGLTVDDQVVLRVLEPVDSDYGFATGELPELTFRAPLLPGRMVFVACTTDGAVTSGPVAIEVSP